MVSSDMDLEEKQQNAVSTSDYHTKETNINSLLQIYK